MATGTSETFSLDRLKTPIGTMLLVTDTSGALRALDFEDYEARMKELLTKLVGFGTRNTLSDQDNATRGIGAARNWILEEMRRSSDKL